VDDQQPEGDVRPPPARPSRNSSFCLPALGHESLQWHQQVHRRKRIDGCKATNGSELATAESAPGWCAAPLIAVRLRGNLVADAARGGAPRGRSPATDRAPDAGLASGIEKLDCGQRRPDMRRHSRPGPSSRRRIQRGGRRPGTSRAEGTPSKVPWRHGGGSASPPATMRLADVNGPVRTAGQSARSRIPLRCPSQSRRPGAWISRSPRARGFVKSETSFQELAKHSRSHDQRRGPGASTRET
jgi:hypothetical protein